MGLLEILDPSTVRSGSGRTPQSRARASRFLSDDLDVSVTIVPWQPIWFCAGRPQGGLAT